MYITGKDDSKRNEHENRSRVQKLVTRPGSTATVIKQMADEVKPKQV